MRRCAFGHRRFESQVTIKWWWWRRKHVYNFLFLSLLSRTSAKQSCLQNSEASLIFRTASTINHTSQRVRVAIILEREFSVFIDLLRLVFECTEMIQLLRASSHICLSLFDYYLLCNFRFCRLKPETSFSTEWIISNFTFIYRVLNNSGIIIFFTFFLSLMCAACCVFAIHAIFTFEGEVRRKVKRARKEEERKKCWRRRRGWMMINFHKTTFPTFRSERDSSLMRSLSMVCSPLPAAPKKASDTLIDDRITLIALMHQQKIIPKIFDDHLLCWLVLLESHRERERDASYGSSDDTKKLFKFRPPLQSPTKDFLASLIGSFS